MTPQAMVLLSTILNDQTYHVRTVSGDLFTGKLTAKNHSFVAIEVLNSGRNDAGSHTAWVAVEAIESIEEPT